MSDPSALADSLRELLGIPQLHHELAAARAEIAALKEAVLPAQEWFDRDDCCQLRGMSKSLAERKPYLLPLFGVPEETVPCRKWRRATVLAWLREPLADIEARWLRLAAREQKALEERRKAA